MVKKVPRLIMTPVTIATPLSVMMPLSRTASFSRMAPLSLIVPVIFVQKLRNMAIGVIIEVIRLANVELLAIQTAPPPPFPAAPVATLKVVVIVFIVRQAKGASPPTVSMRVPGSKQVAQGLWEIASVAATEDVRVVRGVVAAVAGVRVVEVCKLSQLVDGPAESVPAVRTVPVAVAASAA
jgi:hypothetical protein